VIADSKNDGVPSLEIGSSPLVSFCLATYKRPERLSSVLASIRAQTIRDYEVIVSDNDPEQSSRVTVESICDARFRYISNSVNVGMVKNFNVALSHARGAIGEACAVQFVNLPPETDYAFYAGHNLLEGWAGGDLTPCHPLNAVLASVRERLVALAGR